MGNCGALNSQESIVHLIEKGDSVKAINMMIEFQELFKAGNTINSFGDTALHYAAALGNMDIVRWLCSHGADTNAENNNGWTPIDSAKLYSQVMVVNFLESAGGKSKYFKDAIEEEKKNKPS